MVKAKDEVESIHPCEFYRPDDIMDEESLYTVPEIARLLQGLEPEVELDPEAENVLVDWAVPWIMVHAEDLVIADPTNEDEPGLYGVRTDD